MSTVHRQDVIRAMTLEGIGQSSAKGIDSYLPFFRIDVIWNDLSEKYSVEIVYAPTRMVNHSFYAFHVLPAEPDRSIILAGIRAGNAIMEDLWANFCLLTLPEADRYARLVPQLNSWEDFYRSVIPEAPAAVINEWLKKQVEKHSHEIGMTTAHTFHTIEDTDGNTLNIPTGEREIKAVFRGIEVFAKGPNLPWTIGEGDANAVGEFEKGYGEPPPKSQRQIHYEQDELAGLY